MPIIALARAGPLMSTKVISKYWRLQKNQSGQSERGVGSETDVRPLIGNQQGRPWVMQAKAGGFPQVDTASEEPQANVIPLDMFSTFSHCETFTQKTQDPVIKFCEKLFDYSLKYHFPCLHYAQEFLTQLQLTFTLQLNYFLFRLAIY